MYCRKIAIANENKENEGKKLRFNRKCRKKILQHQEGVKHVSTDSLLSAFDMKLAHFEMIINRMRRRVISYTIFFFFPSYN